MKSPAFQFYASDFLASTVSLSVKDVGAYIRLLCYQWASGKIPDAPKDIARIAGCKVSPAVLAKFQDGKNERLEQERLKQEQWRAKCAIGGKHSAESRKGSSTNLPRVVGEYLELNANTPSPSPTPSSIPNPDHAREVAEIYDAYPRKVAKPAAIKAIERALKTTTPAELLAKVQAYAAAVALWPKDEAAKFVPYPATWFNSERFNDDPSTWARNSSAEKPSRFAGAF